MATRWVSMALPLNGFLRHGHWLGLRGMAKGWVTGWVSEAWSQVGWVSEAWALDGWDSEAWPLCGFLEARLLGGSLDGFLRHDRWVGHRMGF